MLIVPQDKQIDAGFKKQQKPVFEVTSRANWLPQTKSRNYEYNESAKNHRGTQIEKLKKTIVVCLHSNQIVFNLH